MASTSTGGVKPMQIGGRMIRERERLVGMSDEERKWRAQWVKDQELTAREPVLVEQYHAAFRNPIRRFYQAPLNYLWKGLTPVIGYEKAYYTRFWLGKAAMCLTALYATAYYFKYNQNDWTRKGGWRVIHSRKRCVPGDADFPRLSDRSKPADYADRGFKASPI